MARLTKTDRDAFLKATPWTEAPEMRSPTIVEQTPEGRERYCRWATATSKLFKGSKPVRFTGNHWKL